MGIGRTEPEALAQWHLHSRSWVRARARKGCATCRMANATGDNSRCGVSEPRFAGPRPLHYESRGSRTNCGSHAGEPEGRPRNVALQLTDLAPTPDSPPEPLTAA